MGDRQAVATADLFGSLNAEQRQAVETLDGPVLVVAGPGTGKTQLLSLRVVNILQQRDVRPQNILCLTYTDAGARAMVKRLTEMIGRDAYAVQISTFHSFAADLRSRFPEHFKRGAFDRLITSLQSAQLLDSLLKRLNINDPLYQRPFEGVAGNLRELGAFISTLKKSGLSVVELSAIVEQNLGYFAYIENNTDILASLETPLRQSREKKMQFLDELQQKIAVVTEALPGPLRQSVVTLPGSYIPYGQYLARLFAETELYDQDGKTKGYSDLRNALFEGSPKRFKDIKRSQKMASAIRVYQRYQAHLEQHALYDYDDMILEAVRAIEGSTELKQALQEQYQYILIDEFQDTNGSQMRLAELLIEGKDSPNILAVGDDDQAIMRFQGASVEFINQFEQAYPDVRRIVLKTNYRSTPSLIRLGAAVARQIENRSPASKQEKVLVPHRSEVATMVSATPPAAEGGAGHGTVSADEGAAGGAGEGAAGRVTPIATPTTAKFTAKAFPNQDSQYFAVAEDIKNRIDAGFIANSPKPQEAIAVIASNNNSLKQLIPYLESQKISYNYRVSAAVTRIDSLQTLFALIRFVVSYAAGDRVRAEVWLPEILAAKELGLPREVYFPFSQAARRAKSWLAELEQSSEPRLQELFSWLQDTALACANSSLRAALFTLAKPLRDYYRRLQQQQPYATIEFNYGLKAFVAFVEGELCESVGEVVTTEAATDPSGQTTHPPRLKDAIRLLDSAARFHIEISTEIPIVQSDAITLTTAHSSKGLEYELVYLIDADNSTWRGKHGENPIISSNMLLSEKRDDDDRRRLLFVALTRAKDQLNTSFAKSEIVAELLEELTVEDVEPTVEQAQQFSELSWQEQYYPQQAEIADIAKCAFKERSLSASLLSSFVEFDPDALNGVDFFTRQVVNFPFEPSAALEFGNLVHAFLEEYLNRVIKAVPEGDGGEVGVDGAGASGVDGAAGVGASGGEGVDAVDASGADGTPNTLNGVPAAAPDGVASAAPEPPSAPHTVQSIIDEARRRISWLDFEDSEIRHMQQRFDAIVREFLPGFARLAGGDAQAERWLSAVVDEVPLVGKADLIVCDPASRSLRVCDYKTGKAKQRPDSMTAYMRQLRFYKLLIENSSEFEGWTVCGGADVFVEPELGQGGEREQGGEPGRGGRGGGQPPHGGEPQPEPSHGHGSSSGLQEPQFFEVSEAEAEQLRRLIKAVWYRLQNGLFDTQEFLQSAHFKALAATTDEGKKPRKPDLQAAYEQWLIDDYEQRER